MDRRVERDGRHADMRERLGRLAGEDRQRADDAVDPVALEPRHQAVEGVVVIDLDEQHLVSARLQRLGESLAAPTHRRDCPSR